MPAAAHSLRERRGAMARPRRQLAYRGYPVTPMVAHMLARAVGTADSFRPPSSGGEDRAVECPDVHAYACTVMREGV